MSRWSHAPTWAWRSHAIHAHASRDELWWKFGRCRSYTLRGGSERIDSLNFGHTAVKSAIEMHHSASRGTAVASSASACSPAPLPWPAGGRLAVAFGQRASTSSPALNVYATKKRMPCVASCSLAMRIHASRPCVTVPCVCSTTASDGSRTAAVGGSQHLRQQADEFEAEAQRQAAPCAARLHWQLAQRGG